MNGTDLLHALGELDEVHIAAHTEPQLTAPAPELPESITQVTEAAATKEITQAHAAVRKGTLPRWLGLAACFAVVLGMIGTLYMHDKRRISEPDSSVEFATTEPTPAPEQSETLAQTLYRTYLNPFLYADILNPEDVFVADDTYRVYCALASLGNPDTATLDEIAAEIELLFGAVPFANEVDQAELTKFSGYRYAEAESSYQYDAQAQTCGVIDWLWFSCVTDTDISYDIHPIFWQITGETVSFYRLYANGDFVGAPMQTCDAMIDGVPFLEWITCDAEDVKDTEEQISLISKQRLGTLYDYDRETAVYQVMWIPDENDTWRLDRCFRSDASAPIETFSYDTISAILTLPLAQLQTQPAEELLYRANNPLLQQSLAVLQGDCFSYAFAGLLAMNATETPSRPIYYSYRENTTYGQSLTQIAGASAAEPDITNNKSYYKIYPDGDVIFGTYDFNATLEIVDCCGDFGSNEFLMCLYANQLSEECAYYFSAPVTVEGKTYTTEYWGRPEASVSNDAAAATQQVQSLSDWSVLSERYVFYFDGEALAAYQFFHPDGRHGILETKTLSNEAPDTLMFGD